MSFRLRTVMTLSAVLFATAAHANLVQNGGFELTTHGPNAFLGYGISDPTIWTFSGGVAAIYGPGAADTTGADQGGAQTYLWGPNDGSANGLPAASPAGGNYFASDSDPLFAGTLSQSITGLAAGDNYTLSFVYAAAQFRNAAGTNWFGASDSGWQVSLGAQTQDTPTLNIASQGFSGWQSETMTFTATAASETLSFLAIGGPSGVPPVALLDGVSLDAAAVPEPSAVSVLATALAGIGMLYAVRRKRAR